MDGFVPNLDDGCDCVESQLWRVGLVLTYGVCGIAEGDRDTSVVDRVEGGWCVHRLIVGRLANMRGLFMDHFTSDVTGLQVDVCLLVMKARRPGGYSPSVELPDPMADDQAEQTPGTPTTSEPTIVTPAVTVPAVTVEHIESAVWNADTAPGSTVIKSANPIQTKQAKTNPPSSPPPQEETRSE